jgi:hypothetical protein
MSSQLQYKPVSTSCMNVYKKIAGDLSPNKLSFFTIKHPDGRIMKLGSNNMMHLNEGSDVNFQKYTGNNVQSSHLNFISFFKDGNKSYSLRHTGYVLYLHPFTAYNYDFAWYLEPEGTGFNIYNEYGGGMYIGYDEKNDQLRIVPHGSKIIWQIDEYQGNDSKKLKKALAFMNNGQGKYNNVFEDVEACVFPKETLPVMSFDNKCLLKNSDSKATINRTFIESIGGPMVQDRTIANENIRNGKGLYPSSGCGVVTNSDELFKRAVVDSGIVIDYENQKILRILREQIKALKLEIKDLTHVKIPNQHNVLNLAIRRYEHMLRDCNYHKWLKPWLINYGIPYIKRVIEQNRGYLNWLENSYWPAVNNYGKWLSNICRRNNSRVIFYEHCGYGGRAGYVNSGNTINRLERSWNDTISSIKIPPGFKVTLWEDNDQRGNSIQFTNNVDCLLNYRYRGRGGNWNDQVTGLRVEGRLDQSKFGFSMNK